MNPVRIVINEIAEGFKRSKWLPLVTAYVVLSSVIGPGIHFQLLHLPFIAIGLLLAFIKGVRIELASFLLLLYLPVNVVITQPDSVFNSWVRLALFAFVFVFASPLLKGWYISRFRRKILMGVLFLCVLLGLGSFICYFLGINYMYNQADGSLISDYLNVSGGFGGLLIQSIALGMICGLGVLYLLYRSFEQQNKDKKWFYLAIIVLAITILLSASRSALLSVCIGLLVMLYQSKRKNGGFIKVLIGIVLLGMLTYPLWENYTMGLKTKRANDTELGEYGSRTRKWTARMEEFKSSPVYGIGFASVDKRLDVVGIGGVVEPGSSWLGILSMTGILGLLLVIAILIKPFLFLRSHPTPYNTLLSGLMVFICTHMISEGYIFAGGSSLCFIAWLIFGCCNDARYEVPEEIDMIDFTDAEEQ